MIKEITEINFPSYATLSQATVTQNEMGDRTIEATVKIDGGIAPDFSFDWEIEYRGERYIHPLREPQAAKDNQSPKSRIDLTFYEWAIYQMKRYYFVDMATTDAGTAVADKYEASLGLDLVNFVTAFNKVLNHYFGGKILMQIPTGLNAPRSFVEISYSYIWDVLQSVYDIYGVRWNIEYNSANDKYYIKVGFPATELTHTFEYGYNGGLISFERQIQDSDVRNIILGRGGERNLPYLYFKDYEQFHPDNPNYSNQGFTPDPDAVPELENIQFTELRGYTFRCYIQGWKTNPHRQLETADGWEGEVEEYDAERGAEDWAYAKGHSDTKFNPTEYVKDDESIEKYGEMWGSLEKNDDIYPSIQNREAYGQGVVGAVVAVEPILSDDTEAAAKAEAMESTVAGGHIETDRVFAGDLTVTVESEEFEIPTGLTGNVYYQIFCLARPWQQHAGGVLWPDLYGDWKSLASVYVDTDQSTVKLVDVVTGEESSAMGGVVAGKYRIHATLLVHTTEYLTDIDCGIQSVRVVSVEADINSWKPTFDIWIKNIWGTTQGENESDAEYIMRVWGPICGDRTGGEASVVFSSGWLSSSSDYEFPIIGANVLSGGISVDRSREITQGSHVYQSEWKLTLAKSDAELATTGLWIPSTRPNTQAVAGDNFFFIGIDMPHDYVVWAEQALDEYKTAEGLNKLSTANPSWVINFDKVRVHTPEEEDYGVTLASQIAAGAKIHITDPRFTPNEVLDLYVQSLTIEWANDGKMIPNISVVLSERIRAAKNPVKMLQSDVRMLSKQYVSLETVEETIEQIASKRYLTKTGAADTSYSPTSFASKVTSDNFRQGAVGGEGWGSYADGDGNSVIEMDRLIVRKEMLVNSLLINQASYIGGMQIISAASVEISQVIERENFYECIFDQRRGSIGNNFVVDDIAYCSRWDSKNSNVKYYRRKVVAIGANSVSLSKSIVDGEGIPEVNDNIIQYGNYTVSSRQYIIIRDVIGGGYERMLQGLNSVTANGKEYYLAGRIAGQTPEWFVGDRDGQYANYKDGVLNIRGNIYVGSSDTPLEDLAYLASTLGDDGAEGLVLAKQLSVYDGNKVMGGISGVYNSSAPHGGIAAWYGGAKIDHEAQPTVPNYATSLFRMDGTGYLAGGHISWDEDGSVTLDASNVSIGGDATLNQLYQWITRLRSLISIEQYQTGKWVVKVNTTAIDDGGVTRSIDGFYSPGFVSAGGIGTGGGGGGGDVASIYVGTTQYLPDSNGIVHLPAYPDEVNWSNIQGKPSWIGNTKPSYSSSEVINFLGYTPADNASLGNYLPLSGGTLTGDLRIDKDLYLGSTSEISSAYLSIHPEKGEPNILPFFTNDIAFLLKRGGYVESYYTTATNYTPATIAKQGTPITDLTSCFDASAEYCQYSIDNLSSKVVIDLTLHTSFYYSTIFYIDFGSAYWGAKKITVLAGKDGGAYTEVGQIDSTLEFPYYKCNFHAGETGVNKIRIVLTNFHALTPRIAEIGLIGYSSRLGRETFMSRGMDDELFRNLVPQTSTYNLGETNKPWGKIYANKWYPKPGDESVYIEYDTTNNCFKVHGTIVATGNVIAGS